MDLPAATPIEPTTPREPTTIDVERDRGVTVTWDDGQVRRFGLEDLRTSCLCAECRGLREAGGVAWPGADAPRPLRIESARQVGNWGLNLHWNDGHTTGIYTWEVLRAWGSDSPEPGPDSVDPEAGE